MLQQQKFCLKIKLQQLGFSGSKSADLIQSFIDNNVKYELIIDKLIDIKNVIDYFTINEYDEKYINCIACEMIKQRVNSKKVIDIDQVLQKYNYFINEREKLESSSAGIFVRNIDNFDKKLLFYDDFDIKDQIIMCPCRIRYSTKLLYARICYLKEHNKYNYNKEDIYSRKYGFETKYGIKDNELVKRYPLPSKYKSQKNSNKEYTKRELIILNLLFCSMGLTNVEAADLINKLRKKGLGYEQIIKIKDSIKELIVYFNEIHYKQNNINTIISNTACKHSSKRIIRTDSVLINNNYSDTQRELIETNNGALFNINEELLNKKIKLIKDENLPMLIIKNSRAVVQSFNLTYARISFIKSLGESPLKFVKLLFREENRFKYRFGVTSESLLEKFPVFEKRKN